MNIDEKIKRELESNITDMDNMLNDQIRLTVSIFKGHSSKLMLLVGVVILVISALMIWTGIEFFLSHNVNDQLFWGVCLLMTLICQVAMKQWWWMSTNQNALLREVKRLEIALATLAAKIH